MRKLLAVLLAAGMLLAAGCGGGKEEAEAVDINPEEAAKSLVENGGFEETSSLVPIPENLLDSYYAMNDAVTEYAIYIDGSGGTAREVAVLKVEGGSLSAARGVIDTRLDTLAGDFENYRPDEMYKIENAVIVERGNVIIMVLSDDEAQAEKAIEALF